MLKIKDDIDLKKLEKFGFKERHWGYIYYPKNNSPQTRYFSSIRIDGDIHVLSFVLENMSMWCNDLKQLELDFENIQYSYNEFKKLVNDLKLANLVEEVGD